MIGGIVIKTKVLPDRIWVNTVETGKCNDKCAIFVERNHISERIEPGDSLWWQGGFAMWTPFLNTKRADGKGGKDYDIRIPRIGCSGVKEPK